MLIISLALVCSAAAQDKKRLAEPGTQANEAATPAKIERMIKEAAKNYKDSGGKEHFGTLSRVTFYDVAQPVDTPEYVALGGQTVLLVTALAQDRDELPLKRAAIRYAGREIELRLVSSVLSQQVTSSSQATKVFGPYRADALYLLPLHLKFEEADLIVDFAKNRTGLRVGQVSGLLTAGKDENLDLPESPSEAALKALIKREYPKFLK